MLPIDGPETRNQLGGNLWQTDAYTPFAQVNSANWEQMSLTLRYQRDSGWTGPKPGNGRDAGIGNWQNDGWLTATLRNEVLGVEIHAVITSAQIPTFFHREKMLRYDDNVEDNSFCLRPYVAYDTYYYSVALPSGDNNQATFSYSVNNCAGNTNPADDIDCDALKMLPVEEDLSTVPMPSVYQMNTLSLTPIDVCCYGISGFCTGNTLSDEDTDCAPTRQQLVEFSDAVHASADDPVASCCDDYVGRCLGNTDPALDFDCENLGGIAAADAQGKPGADFAACLATGGEVIFITYPMPVCLVWRITNGIHKDI
jgi:hypothetical protein